MDALIHFKPQSIHLIATKKTSVTMGNVKSILYKISLIIVVVLCNSCQKENHKLLSLFERGETIQHTKIEIINQDYLSKVGGVCINDSCLIITDKNGETWIDIFDLKSKQIVKRFIKFGNGPNEMFSPPQAITILKNNQLSYLDIQTKKLYLADFLELDSIQITRQIDLIDSKTFFMGIIPMANNFYIGIGFLDKGRYAVLDTSGSVISYNFDFPTDETNQSSKAHKAMAYQGRLVRNKKGTKFFYYCFYSEIVEIISMDRDGILTKIKYIHFDKAQYVPEGQKKGFVSSAIKRESKKAFLDAEATEEYIYLLYSGRVIGDNIDKSFKGNTILIFDWNGNPVNRYNLDIDVTHITVSEDNKTLYAIAELDDTEIVKFNL